MSEVKRYTHGAYLGVSALPQVDSSVSPVGEWVRYEDYAAVKAECVRLDRESQNLSDQLGACDRERRFALAKLAEQAAELVPKKLTHQMGDYPVQEAAINSWNACVDAILRNIEEANKK